jgi:hypothetical protein
MRWWARLPGFLDVCRRWSGAGAFQPGIGEPGSTAQHELDDADKQGERPPEGRVSHHE